jgi:alpha-tubulin suppressor-like RCC1 family protein
VVGSFIALCAAAAHPNAGHYRSCATPALTRVNIIEFFARILPRVSVKRRQAMRVFCAAVAVALCGLSNAAGAQAPIYDPASGELRLTPVKVGDASYLATLKDLGGLTFKLQSAVEQPAPPPACALYDVGTGTLTLLAVRVGAAAYRATLANLGDYTFRVTMATEADALCISAQPSFRVAAGGGSARFEVGAAGTGVTYRWQRSNDGGAMFSDIAGANAASYTLPSVGAGDDRARFRAIVSNAAASLTSDAARLRVAPSAHRIAAGFRHVVARKADGTVVAWGGNNGGQLGDGTQVDRPAPVQVQGLADVVALAANKYYSLALKSDGTVWGWGSDDLGQIGDVAAGGERLTPVQAAGLSKIVALEAGEDFALALHDDGTVYSWGNNFEGELGSGLVGGGVRQTPAPVLNLTDVAKIAAGRFTAYAIETDGTLWGWGYNYLSRAIDPDSTVGAVPMPARVALPGGERATDAALGPVHQMVRRGDGSLLAWGDNNGRVGDGTKLFRASPVAVLSLGQVTAFAACNSFSLAAAAPDGAPFAWGPNTVGELGIGTIGVEVTPHAISGLAHVVEFACRNTNGNPFSIAVTAGGQVWAWGSNDFGQLGDGTLVDRIAPVNVPGLTLN